MNICGKSRQLLLAAKRYRQAQDGRQLCNKPTKEEDKPKKMDYIIIVCNQCFGYPLIKVTTAVTNNTLQAS